MAKSFCSKSRVSPYTRLAASSAAAVYTVPLFRLLLLASLWYYSSLANISMTEVKECPTNVSRNIMRLWYDAFALQNSTCYLTLPKGNFFSATLGHGTSDRQFFGFPRLRLVALMTTSRNGSEEWCGFCPVHQSYRNENPEHTLSSSRSGSVEVRRCVNQRSATTSFHPLSWLTAAGQTPINSHLTNSSWFAAIGWTHEQRMVILDGSCANHELYFLHTNQPALTVCGQTANVLNLKEYIRPLYFILFAQDRVLSSWLMLPDEYACSDGSDYAMVISVESGTVDVEIDIYMGPARNSCRVLCVADECDIDFQSQKKINYEVNVNRSLTLKYNVRSAALNCDSLAYSGFASRIGWPIRRQFLIVTKYELYSRFRAAEKLNIHNATDEKNAKALQDTTAISSADSGIMTIATSSGAALTVVVAASIFIARWILWCTRRQSVNTFKRNAPDAATNDDKGLSSDTACLAILKCKGSCSWVSSAGILPPSMGAATPNAPRPAGSAGPALPRWSMSEQYAEIQDVEPPSSNNRLLTTISSHDILLEGRERSTLENTSLSASPLGAETDGPFLSAGNRLLDLSLDEHVYGEVDGPDARYMHAMTSDANSLYSDLF